MQYAVFIVHSSLTDKVARQIMAAKALDPARCLWLTDRAWNEAPPGVAVADISALNIEPFRARALGTWGRVWQHNRGVLRQLDALIEQHCPAAAFVLHLPHSKIHKYYVLITHPRCDGLYYFEEGVGSYVDPFGHHPEGHPLQQWLMTRLMSACLHGRAPGFLPLIDPRLPQLRGAYAITEFAYPGLPGVQVLPLPFQRSAAYAGYRHVLVTGPFAEMNYMPLGVQLSTIERVLDLLAKRLPAAETLYYKFHPTQLLHQQSVPALRALFQRYADRLRIEELPAGVSLEEIAVSAQANFYLASSSVAVYAIAAGSRVFTYGEHYMALAPAYRPIHLALPAAVRERMEILPGLTV